MKYVIGIDGGGTKTTAILSNLKGEVIKQFQVQGSNPSSTGWDTVKKELSFLVHGLVQSDLQKSEVVSVFAGMAGADHPTFNSKMTSILQELFPNTPNVVVDNDAITALYSGTQQKPSMVLISGTGSIAYGLDEEGNKYRTGGWGYLIGDEGSGYQMGRMALNSIMREYDYRGKQTVLQSLVMKALKITNQREIVPLVYQNENPRTLLASLSKYVSEAASQGDEVATAIVKQTAFELTEHIKGILLQMNITTSKQLSVVLAGGVLTNNHFIIRHLTKEIQSLGYTITIVSPTIPPVGGALIQALKNAGVKVGEDHYHMIASSFKKVELEGMTSD